MGGLVFLQWSPLQNPGTLFGLELNMTFPDWQWSLGFSGGIQPELCDSAPPGKWTPRLGSRPDRLSYKHPVCKGMLLRVSKVWWSQNKGLGKHNICPTKGIEETFVSPCGLGLTNKHLSDPEWSYNRLFEVETSGNECFPSGSVSFPQTCSGSSSLSQVEKFHPFWGLGTNDWRNPLLWGGGGDCNGPLGEEVLHLWIYEVSTYLVGACNW